jgi:hypothetical protein
MWRARPAFALCATVRLPAGLARQDSIMLAASLRAAA